MKSRITQANLPVVALVLCLTACINVSISYKYNKQPCNLHHADIVLAADVSSSISPSDFRSYVRPFLQRLTTRMYRRLKSHAHVAVFSFATDVDLRLPLSSHANKVHRALRRLQHTGGLTNTGGLLRRAAQHIQSYASHLHQDSFLPPRILVVVTDGRATTPPPVSATVGQAKRNFDLILAVGVGKQADLKQLKRISKGAPVLHVSTPAQLGRSLTKAVRHLCRTVLRKRCPSPRQEVRCAGARRVVLNISYSSWRGGCLRRLRRSQKLVPCPARRRTRYVRKGCRRVWTYEEWRLNNCHCEHKRLTSKAGTWCCPKKKVKKIRRHDYERTVTYYHDNINGRCFTRKVSVKRRLKCPRGGKLEWCYRESLLSRRSSYRLTRAGRCVHTVLVSQTPVHCYDHWSVMLVSKCHKIYDRRLYALRRRYRGSRLGLRAQYVVKARFIFKEPSECNCQERVVIVGEPCKCAPFPNWRRRWVTELEAELTRLKVPRRHAAIQAAVQHLTGPDRPRRLRLYHCARHCGVHACPASCFRLTVWLSYPQNAYGHCLPRIVAMRRYPCCCSKKRRRRRFCSHGRKVVMTRWVRMRGSRCVTFVRRTSTRVLCSRGIVSRVTKRLPDGRLIVEERRRYRRRCQCLIRTRRIICRWKCRAPRITRRCRQGIIIRRIRFWVLIGCRCFRRVRRERIRVSCPEYTLLLSRRCDRVSGRFMLLQERSRRVGCRCRRRTFEERGPPCRCPLPIISPWRCVKHKRYVRTVVRFQLLLGQCLRTVNQEERMAKKCPPTFITVKCIKKTGIRLVFRHRYRHVNCRCVVSKKLIRRQYCHCDAVNKRYSHLRKIRCDRRRNVMIYLRLFYVFDALHYLCIKKWLKREVQIKCPKTVAVKVGDCDTHTRRRAITRTTKHPVNCRCQPREVTNFIECDCIKRVVHRRCDGKTGVWITVVITGRWDKKLERCIIKRKTIHTKVRCPTKVQVLKTRCNKQHFTVTKISFIRRPRTCACMRLVVSKDKKCRCPRLVRKTACKRYYQRISIIIRTWDEKRRRCVVVKVVRYRRRCACPPPKRTRRCVSGVWVTTTVSYILHRHVCVRTARRKIRHVPCPRDLRYKKGPCRHCRQTVTVLARFSHPSRCVCVFRPIIRRVCRCCPVPKTKIRRRCRGRFWHIVTTSYRPIKDTLKCIVAVASTTQERMVAVRCKAPPRPKWARCNKKTCWQKRHAFRVVIRQCRCHVVIITPKKRRRCCCLRKPFCRRFCKRGLHVLVCVQYVFKKYQCIRIKTKITVASPCRGPQPAKLIRGPCRNCIRSVYVVRLVRKDNCKCAPVKKLLFKELCCCKRKGYTRRICAANCRVTKRVFFVFNKRQLRCERRVDTSVTCVSCRPRQRIRGDCKRPSCFRYIHITTWHAAGCRCLPTRRRIIRRCCCPRPTPWLRRCHAGRLTRRRTIYLLRRGACIKVVQTQNVLVPCARGLKLIQRRCLPCERASCRRLCVRVYEKRVGCKCRRFSRRVVKVCCCPPPSSRIVCLRNNRVVRVDISYHLERGRCRRKRQSVVLNIIKACSPIVSSSACNPKTHKRRVTTTFFNVRHCRCRTWRRRVRVVPCKCAALSVHEGPCRKKVCKRAITRVWFVLINHACRRRKIIYQRTCCCLPPLVIRKKRCNTGTGQNEVIVLRRVYHAASHRCFRLRFVTSSAPACLLKKVSIVYGHCNRKTGLAVDRVTSFHPVRTLCACKRRVRRRTRRCACRHPGCSVTVSCRGGVRTKRRVCYRFIRGVCRRFVSVSHNAVVCDKEKKERKVCSGCHGVLYTTVTKRVRCSCVKRTTSRSIRCCCPKPILRRRCRNPFWVHTTIAFLLTDNRTQCRRIIVLRVSKEVKCRKHKKIVVGSCDRDTCNRPVTTLYFGVRRCRCLVVRRVSRTIKCCCPKRTVRVRCNPRTGVKRVVKVSYSLSGGRCVQHASIDDEPTECQAVTITSKPCNPKTRRRLIIIRTYYRYRCVCRARVTRHYQLCLCKPPKINKGPCHRGIRSVYRIWHVLRSTGKQQVCRKRRRLLYMEPCVCGRSYCRRSCEGKYIVKRCFIKKLVIRFGQNVCITRIRKTVKKVTCQKSPKEVRGKCKSYRRVIKRISWIRRNCQCESVKSRDIEACDCHKKKRRRRFCRRGTFVVVKERWSSKPLAQWCIKSTVEREIPVVCDPPVSQPLTAGCPIVKYYGRYRQYRLVWWVKRHCKCHRRQRIVERLCRCRKETKDKRCVDNVLVKRVVRYFRRHKRCYRKVKVIRRFVACAGQPVSARYLHCVRPSNPRRPCSRIVVITVIFVRRCRCRKRKRRLVQLCCAPRKRVKRYCNGVRGEWVTVTRHYFLRTVGLLFNRGGVVVVKRAVRSVVVRRRDPVVCPPGSIHIHCNRYTKRKTITHVTVTLVGCKCKRRRWVTHGHCDCPPPRKIVGPCVKRFRKVVIIYHVLVGTKCRRRKVVRRQRCGCKSGKRWRRCVGTHWQECTLRYVFVIGRKRCVRRIVCRHLPVVCPPPKIIPGKCVNGKQRMTRVWYRLLAIGCKCEAHKEHYYIRCPCKPGVRITKKCIGNLIKKVIRRKEMVNGVCLKTVVRTAKEKVCPPPSVKYLGDCNRIAGTPMAGYESKVFTRYILHHCRCIKRIQKISVPCACHLIPGFKPVRKVFCQENILIISLIYWKVVKDECLRHHKEIHSFVFCRRIMKKVKGICRKHKDGNSYRTDRYYVQRKKKCHCLWKKIAEVVRVCKCRRPRKIVRCRHHNEIHTQTTTYKLISGFYCRYHTTYCVRLKKCKATVRTVGPCKRPSCIQRVKHIVRISRRCRCRKVVHYSSRRCCCPQGSPKRPSCTADGKTKIVRWTTYQLASGRCVLVRHVTTTRVNCESRPPIVVTPPCKGYKHVVRQTITVFRTRSCTCVPVKTFRVIACSCSPRLLYKPGTCRGKWTIDRWLGLRYDAKRKRCVHIVVKKRRRLCRCPKDRKHSVCVRHTIWRTVFVTYRLQSATNSCSKTVVRREHQAGRCTRRPALVRQILSKCDSSTGYYQVDRLIYKVARKCRCRRIVKTRRWPCDCQKLFPPRRVRKCVGHRRRVLIISEKHNKGHKCVPKTTQSSWIVYCLKRRTERDACKGCERRWVRHLRQKAENCRCVWYVHKRWQEPCCCPTPTHTHKCLQHRILRRIYVVFRRYRGRCYERKVIRDVSVACRVGRVVRRSACHNGRFTEMTVTRTLRDCQCLVKKRQRSCRCRCRPGGRSIRCIPKMVRVVKHVLYFLRKCGCTKRTIIRQWTVKCLPSRCTSGPCVLRRGRDTYRSRRCLIVKGRRCVCHHRVVTRIQLCKCAPHFRRRKQCIGNRLTVITTSRRMLIRGRCVRVATVSKSFLKCNPPTKTVVCRKGVRVTTYRKEKAIRCRCRASVRVVKSRCRCDSTLRLIKVGVCRKSCRRTDVYSYQKLVNPQKYQKGRCVTRRIYRQVVCCCKPKSTERKCLENKGAWKITTTTYRLIGAHCVKSVQVRIVLVVCSSVIRRQRIRKSNGILIIRTFFYQRRGCRCLLTSRTEFCRWACPHPKLLVTCWRHTHWRRLHVSYKLLACKCRMESRVDLVPILCPFRQIIQHPCRPVQYGTARTTLRVWYVKRKCICRRRQRLTSRVCECWPPRVHRYCDAAKGKLRIITDSFKPAANSRKCKRVRQIKVKQIECDDQWRPYEKGPCYTVLQRQRREGCRCRLELRKIRKVVDCPPSPKPILINCNRFNCMGRYKKITVVSRRCRCVKKVSFITKPCCHISCPPTKHQQLGPCRNGIVRVEVISYSKVRGFCRKRIVIATWKLRCPQPSEMAVGRCIRGQRSFLRTEYRRYGCRCSPHRSKVSRRCQFRIRPTELVILIDARLHDSSFHLVHYVRSYVTALVASFPASQVRVGVVKVGARPTVVFPLTKSPGLELRNLRIALEQPWRGRRTNMAAALRLVETKILPLARRGVTTRLVVISGGEFTKPAAAVRLAERLRRRGVVISTLALRTDRRGRAQLRKLASKPKRRHSAVVRFFRKLRFMLGFIRHLLLSPITKY